MNSPEILKIMLVDDRPENLTSLKQLLDRPDLEILTAESGNVALGLMLDHDLALVLLDVQMPEMDGFEVAELMRRNVRTKEIPIIFVTAINKERRHIFTGYEAGAVDYIFKPVDPFIIRSKVNVFLEIKRNHLVRAKLVAELNQANNRLQEISDRKSDFLSAASHELRTPLTVIKEYTSLVLEEIVGPLNEDQKACLTSSLRNCNRLAMLVNDLLDLDSIESGYSHLKREKVELPLVINNIVKDFSKQCKNAGQILQIDCAVSLPSVLGDSGMLTQVLVNLMGNACKFTPAGGKILIRAKDHDGGVRVSILDNGPGIGKKDQARVFEKFSQLNRRSGPGAQGTGLGLPISNKIVEMHEGKLELESEEGLGSTFFFQLPIYNSSEHIRTFVSDGITSVGSQNHNWNLVYLKPDTEAHSLPSDLTKEVERLFREGEDRSSEVLVEDRRWVLVLLRTDKKGVASFLSRLEEHLEARSDYLQSITYAVHPIEVTDMESIPVNPTKLHFHELGRVLEKVRS